LAFVEVDSPRRDYANTFFNEALRQLAIE